MLFPRRAAWLPVSVSVAARLSVIGAVVVLGGCAANQASREGPSHVAGPPGGQGPATARVLIEDDGFPAQLAPRNPRPVADDPSEPWSPNYGNRALPKTADQKADPVPRSTTGGGVPTRPVRPAPTRLAEADEDAIIRQAIAEHEMRRGD